jgi:hypothetical protein
MPLMSAPAAPQQIRRSLGRRRRSAAGQRRGSGSLGRRLCLGFLAQSDGRRVIAPAAEAAAPAGLLRPQRRCVFRLRSFTLGGPRTVVLFAPRGSLVLASLRFVPEIDFALGRCQLLAHGDDRKALRNPAALNASAACRFDGRNSLLSPVRDRRLHRIVFGFAHHRGCFARRCGESGSDQSISCH